MNIKKNINKDLVHLVDKGYCFEIYKDSSIIATIRSIPIYIESGCYPMMKYTEELASQYDVVHHFKDNDIEFIYKAASIVINSNMPF